MGLRRARRTEEVKGKGSLWKSLLASHKLRK